jgi:hypothetical protein
MVDIEDEVRSDRSSEREINQRFKRSSDNFGNLKVRNTNNKANLAAHYPLNPERYRFEVNGTQRYLSYGVPAEVTDSTDSFDIDPSPGDTNTLRTAERWRYPVGFTVSISWAEQLNQSLTGNDVYVRGFGNTDQSNTAAGEALGPGADGWFVVNDASMQDNHLKFVIYRDGVEKSSETVVANRPITSHRRIEIEFDWYNVGSAVLVESFVTVNGEQLNPVLSEVGVDDNVQGVDKGPETGNKQVEFSITTDSNDSGLELSVGSIGIINNGSTDPINRIKTARLDVTYGAGGDDWLPVAAIREDDPDEVINTQLQQLNIANKSDNSADLQLLALAVNQNNTDATGFTNPVEHNQFNSVIEQTTTVTTQPDPAQSDPVNVVTTSNALANPGGWQLGYASSFSSGQGSNTQRSTSSEVNPRNFYPDDVILLMARSNVDNLDFTVEYVTEQQY